MAVKRITTKQKRARRKNIAVARKSRWGNKASIAARKAFVKKYKDFRSSGGSKTSAKVFAFKAAHKKGARWTYSKGRSYALGVARKQGIKSKTGRNQFARGFTKAIRSGW